MSTDSNQIQLYVNLEPHAVQKSGSINYDAYFDHLLRAMEIPMIHFLEQLYNEAGIRAKNDPSVTPLEFQVILREFVRQPSEERKKVFIEHLQNGKHTLDHLGTICLLALRELTQSLASSDYELVALSQSQSDAPRFQVQAGVTFLDLFIDAEIEAARLMDRNPTYFSRSVSSTRHLENRAVIRSEIEKALAASIHDSAIKNYLSLRQHVADSAMQNTNAKTALQEQQLQRKSDFRSNSQTRKAAQQTWHSAIDVDNLADTPPLPSPKKQEKVAPMTAAAPVPTISPKKQIVDLDQRASPLSSNEAKQAQQEFDNRLQKSKVPPTKTEQPPAAPPAIKTNLQEGRIRLEEPLIRSAQTASKKTEEKPLALPRANSDNMIRKDVGMASEDLLGGEEMDDDEGEEEGGEEGEDFNQ